MVCYDCVCFEHLRGIVKGHVSSRFPGSIKIAPALFVPFRIFVR